jgi:hypothetical protein
VPSILGLFLLPGRNTISANSSAASKLSTRRRLLRTVGSIEHRRLANKIESCAPKARCRSVAFLARCRRLRSWFIWAVWEILGEIPNPIVATLIPGDQAVPTGDIQNFSPKRFGGMLQQQLRRASAGCQIIVGGIDGEYNQRHQAWHPRAHRIAPAALKPTFDELRDRFYPRSGRVHRPVLKQPLDNATSERRGETGIVPCQILLDAEGATFQSCRQEANGAPAPGQWPSRRFVGVARPIFLGRFQLPCMGSVDMEANSEMPDLQADDGS